MNARVAVASGWRVGVMSAWLLACGQRAAEPPAANTTPPDPQPPAASADAAKPATGELCNGEPCAPPQQCIRYAGIAGPQVPLYTCAIPCSAEGTCPTGTTCQVIADGPRLCR